VLVWQRQAGRRWLKIEPTDPMAQLLAGQAGKSDRFISVNEFDHWRLVKLLRSLRAVYVDLDNCPGIDEALARCDDAVLPTPSYAVESGRGVHLYWLIDAAPPKALPVWQAIQTRLVQVLSADPACADCTRVLRLVGTRNSRNDAEAVGYIVTGQRWSLHDLADEVLGHRTRPAATVTGLGRARSKRAVRSATGTFQLWHGRYVDLCTIADHWAFMRGVPEGHRDTVLFLLSVSLSWFTRSDSLASEISRVARTYVPSFTEAEAMTYTRPIIRRAVMAANGLTVEYNGEQVDPRYRFKTETLRSWLGDLIEPVQDRLRVLVPRHVLDERERERLRQRDGVKQERSEYLAQFTDSQNAKKPWEALGISRATYFRRKTR
jgi:ElaB/YqjD/DUF883 family membrane-anchored ribosome-binding protein